MAKLRIMSNNIWWCDKNTEAWGAQGLDCSAGNRAPGLLRMYQETQPDIIGLQECSSVMAHQLMTLFAENDAPYALLWGRNTPIIYRRDVFELIDSEVHVYPEQIPGLEGSFNDRKTKSCCISVLRLKESGKLIIFATTHLWYKTDSKQPGSEKAKAWQLSQLLDRLDVFQAQYDCPAVVVGDFNTWPTGIAVRTATERGFTHAHDIAIEHADDTSGMHYCYSDGYNNIIREGGFAHSIDHILIRGVLPVSRFERYCPDYYLPLSDHSPAWIDTEL